jgi:hypothetical protein
MSESMQNNQRVLPKILNLSTVAAASPGAQNLSNMHVIIYPLTSLNDLCSAMNYITNFYIG